MVSRWGLTALVAAALVACGARSMLDDGSRSGGLEGDGGGPLDGDVADGTVVFSDAGSMDSSEADAADAAPCVIDADSPYLVDAVDLSVGSLAVCAVRANGTVACWGYCQWGECGANTGRQDIPNTIQFPADAGKVTATRVATDYGTACALDTNGGVWCWGHNGQGELGSGAAEDDAQHFTPSRVVDATKTPITAVDLANGWAHFCAMTSAGKVLCWGDNQLFELGSDAGVDSNVAIEVPGQSLVAGHLGLGASAVACDYTDTTVACWGDNDQGQSGVSSPLGKNATAFDTAVAASLLDAGATSPFVSVARGLYHACALDKKGRVYCWGGNDGFERGNSSVTPASPPNVVSGLLDASVVGISGGVYSTCAVDSTQHARCWGSGGYGALGGGVPVSQTADPQLVVGVDGGGALFPVGRVVEGTTGTVCALLVGACGPKGPGQVVCWGGGAWGELGIGVAGEVGSDVPVQVLASPGTKL